MSFHVVTTLIKSIFWSFVPISLLKQFDSTNCVNFDVWGQWNLFLPVCRKSDVAVIVMWCNCSFITQHGCTTTSRKVMGSSPDEVDFFNSTSCTMAQGSTQPLTNEYHWGVKGCRRVKLIALPLSVSGLSRENVGALTSQLWSFTACYRDNFTF
jgi:hypothetical protein